jgi:hypothetical protein
MMSLPNHRNRPRNRGGLHASFPTAGNREFRAAEQGFA